MKRDLSGSVLFPGKRFNLPQTLWVSLKYDPFLLAQVETEVDFMKLSFAAEPRTAKTQHFIPVILSSFGANILVHLK